jgi:hypothetical protein
MLVAGCCAAGYLPCFIGTRGFGGEVPSLKETEPSPIPLVPVEGAETYVWQSDHWELAGKNNLSKGLELYVEFGEDQIRGLLDESGRFYLFVLPQYPADRVGQRVRSGRTMSRLSCRSGRKATGPCW